MSQAKGISRSKPPSNKTLQKILCHAAFSDAVQQRILSLKVTPICHFQTAASVLMHRLPHSAKPPSRILPQRGINLKVTILHIRDSPAKVGFCTSWTPLRKLVSAHRGFPCENGHVPDHYISDMIGKRVPHPMTGNLSLTRRPNRNDVKPHRLILRDLM